MDTGASSSEQHHRSGAAFSGFSLRVLILIIIIGVLMAIGNVNIGAIGQGLGYALVGVCVFITYRVLGFVDLTVDGAFPIGGAVCAMLILAGVSPEMAVVAAAIAGALTGLATALIDIIFKIEGLLASIIVITGAYTVNLHIMNGRSNVPLLGEETLISRSSRDFRAWMVEQFGDGMRRQSTNMLEILLFGLIVIIVLLILYWFLRTEVGLAIRATGRNPQMVRATGIDHYLMIIFGLMAANGLAGIAGSMVVQQFGFADVSLGFGLIIRGLAAVILGEVLLRPQSVGQMLIAAVGGMLVFDISRAWIFSALDLPPTDIQLVSALVVMVALGAPRVHDRWKTFRRRQSMG